MTKEMRKLSRTERAILACHYGLFLTPLWLSDPLNNKNLLAEFDRTADNYQVVSHVPAETPVIDHNTTNDEREVIIKADMATRVL